MSLNSGITNERETKKIAPNEDSYENSSDKKSITNMNTIASSESVMEAFVKAIYIQRKLLCLSQRDLAKKAGITQASISRIENMVVDRPSTQTLKRLCLTLGLDYNFWLKSFGYEIAIYNPKKPSNEESMPDPDSIYFLGKRIPIKDLSFQDFGLITTILNQYD